MDIFLFKLHMFVRNTSSLCILHFVLFSRQQKRKEVEDKRSDYKSDKRS
jgi:hypothetical protein